MKSRKEPENEPRAASATKVPSDRAPLESAWWQQVLSGPWQTLLVALVGSLLLYVSLPLLAWWPIAWIAPIPWLWLIAQKQLAARRPYLAIYLASWVFWLALLQGVRLAHPLLIFGWIALAAYLAAYLPLFVVISRIAVDRWKLPLQLVAPIVWVGLEFARGHLITGFALGGLAYTQTRWITILQTCDLAGAYGLSGLMMLVAAGIFAMFRADLARSSRIAQPAIALVALVAAMVYGQSRLAVAPEKTPILSVALIQGSLDTVFMVTPERVRETISQYADLTSEARDSIDDLDLVIWPESMMPIPRFDVVEPLADDRFSQLTADQLRVQLEESNRYFDSLVSDGLVRLNPRRNINDDRKTTCWLLGCNTIAYGPGPTQIYNSALLLRSEGPISRYDKMHPVMFGEYVPLTDLFPFLYDLTPMAGGLTPGAGPVVMQVADAKLSPSICFESTVPHLIREQVAMLEARGERPDCLVNITNDGWFWGSSLLDMHLHCAVMRAVENRRPMLVAANTGFSASIDGRGQIAAVGPRREKQVIPALVYRETLRSPYLVVGDTPALLCAVFAWLVAIVHVSTDFARLLRTPRMSAKTVASTPSKSPAKGQKA